MDRLLIVTILLFLGFGCTTHKPIPYGRYQQKAGEKAAVLFEQKEISLFSNHTFEYISWHDDISSSSYGKGSFRQSNGKLILTFDGNTPPLPEVQIREAASGIDSLTFSFHFYSSSDSGRKSIPGVNVMVYNSMMEILKGTTSNPDGRAEIKVARNATPTQVRVSYIGFRNLEFRIPEGNMEASVWMQPAFGRVYKAGEQFEFQILKVGKDKIRLKRGQGKFVLSRISNK